MQVKVLDNFESPHHGAFTKGDARTLPDEDAAIFIQRGLVEEVKSAIKSAKAKEDKGDGR